LREIELKSKLYFEAGAVEFWICDENGKIAFYGKDGPVKASQLFPVFPGKLDI
jgi:hypothetical protein